MGKLMSDPLVYRGRIITDSDLVFLRELIAANPQASRWALSRLVCEAWDWRQANGALRDMVCRGMMLMLHRAGKITLPEKKRTPANPLASSRRSQVELDLDQSPMRLPLGELRPVQLRQVRRTPDEKVFNALIARHHYLGYTQPVGEHLKYLAYANGRPVACFGLSSAPWHMGPRDRYIGWSPQVRRRNLHLLAYNTRFLILPWVEVPHLASHLLGMMSRHLSADWQTLYAHPVYYLETFVDRERYAGTCYRAANWRLLGQTTGRGIRNKSMEMQVSVKDVLGLPLCRNFRERLCAEAG